MRVAWCRWPTSKISLSLHRADKRERPLCWWEKNGKAIPYVWLEFTPNEHADVVKGARFYWARYIFQIGLWRHPYGGADPA